MKRYLEPATQTQNVNIGGKSRELRCCRMKKPLELAVLALRGFFILPPRWRLFRSIFPIPRLRGGLLTQLLLITVQIGWVQISIVHADGFQPLFRGARAQAMGNAFTAVADDEQAIFYNPAGLAGIKDLSVRLLSVNAEASGDAISSVATIQDQMSNPGIGLASSLIGKNIGARIQGTSSVVMPRFGIAAIVDEQAVIALKNTASPTGVYGVQSTYGFQGAFGAPIYKFRRKRGEIRLGAAVKMLWRAGGFIHPTLSQIMSVDTTALKGNFTTFGSGVGVDTGLQYVYAVKKKYTFQAGLAVTDIGNTTFSSGADPQLSNMTMGISGSYQGPDMKATISYDYSNILTSMDWRKRNHLGVELKFPILSLYGGVNQIYFTYGAGLNLGLIKVVYCSYAQELASQVGQDPERRHLLSVSLSFDP